MPVIVYILIGGAVILSLGFLLKAFDDSIRLAVQTGVNAKGYKIVRFIFVLVLCFLFYLLADSIRRYEKDKRDNPHWFEPLEQQR